MTVNELILGVNIALGMRPLENCSRFDEDGNDRIEVNELIRGVGNALTACGTAATPTPTVTRTPREGTPIPTVAAPLSIVGLTSRTVAHLSQLPLLFGSLNVAAKIIADNARRMVQVAARPVDHVSPSVPMRQWVPSLPKRLRCFMRQREASL